MKIINKYNWNRRDFSFDAKCENCDHLDKKISGYDDENYYLNVIPALKCTACKESTISLNGKVDHVVLKYNPYTTI